MESTIETNGGSAPQAGRNKVRALDLFVAVGGVAVLVGLAFEWNGGSGASGYEGISVLRVFLVLVGLAGVALPVVLASTRKSDVPVIWEATLAPVASVFLVIVAVKVVLPPEGGVGAGMLVTAAGLLVLSVSCWNALSRES